MQPCKYMLHTQTFLSCMFLMSLFVGLVIIFMSKGRTSDLYVTEQETESLPDKGMHGSFSFIDEL